ncbi:MAG: glycerol kinase GlpK [Cyclobacteriaceae bacterium]|nr:glycerol kinase GlpK [Cyclobacteriaceae bacterium]
MATGYILSIDQSTSGTKAILFNKNAEIFYKESIDHKQYYPQPGWVEHDPAEIYQNVFNLIQSVTGKFASDAGKIQGIAITNQRETVVVWDKTNGEPVYNAIVWQCQRGEKICADLKEKGLEKTFREKAGLIIDPYFSASGIQWILDNIDGARKKAEKGDLLFGTIDSWLIWNLSGGKVHATDHSNACRTLLYNIQNMDWDHELLDYFKIPHCMCPAILHSDAVFCEYTPEHAEDPLPVSGVLGDSHAAFFAQGCYAPGMAKATYGTGSSIMMNIGPRALIPPKGLVTSIGFSTQHEVHYVYEGNIHMTGDTIKWLCDNLQLISHPSEAEYIAKTVASTEGVYLVPAFVGLGAPYWDNQARALICGMNRGTGKAHIIRAALESIAYQVKDLIDLMVQGAGLSLQELRVDGGPSSNRMLMQFQSDILQCRLNKSQVDEASALGAALMAGLALGIYPDLQALQSVRSNEVNYSCAMPSEESRKLYEGWKNALSKAITKPD